MTTESTPAAIQTTQDGGTENIGNAGPTGDERAALIALVEKTKEGAPAEGEADKEKQIRDGIVQTKDPKEKDPDEPPVMSKLAKELKAREKEKGILARAQEREQAAQAAYAEAQGIVEQAKAFAAQVAGEFQRLKRLKDDPVAVINEFGWDPNAIIEAGARHKDPEYQARTAAERAANEKLAAMEQKLQAALERTEKLEKVAQGYNEQATTAQKVAAEQKLLGKIPETSPARQLISARIWSEKTILEMAYDADRQIRTKTRKAPSLDELAEYIHYEAYERMRALGMKPQESAGRSNAGKSKANGSRALSNRDASERRGAQHTKAFDEMTPDEQRAYLIAVAEEARRVG